MKLGIGILVFFPLLFTVLCALPLFLRWEFHDILGNESPILMGHSSQAFETVLICGTSISVFMFLDVALLVWKSPRKILNGRMVVNITLLFFVVLPNVIILLYVIPFRNLHVLGFLLEISLELKRIRLCQLSHEMRTPLNCVVLGLDLLRDKLAEGDLYVEEQIILEDISKSCQIATAILDNMLTSDYLESTYLILEKSKFSAREFLSEIVNHFKRQAAHLGIELTLIILDTKINNNDVDIIADRSKLGQVISNLLSNALKFTPSGGAVTVMARLASSSYSSTRLVIEVNDTGCGISLVS
eukprot:gene10031-20891_t